VQPALSTKVARTYIVEGSREAASSSKLLWLQKHLPFARGAWCKVLERREQVDEAAEAEDLGIRVIIGEGSFATAPRGISAAGNTLIFFFGLPLTLLVSRAHTLASMHVSAQGRVYPSLRCRNQEHSFAARPLSSYKCIHSSGVCGL
jgi:hypothetical protein